MNLRIPSLITTTTLVILLSSCATNTRSPGQRATNLLHGESITPTTHDHLAAKKPEQVLVLKNEKPQKAYRVIGVAKVSKRKWVGENREDETVHAMMKRLAASIGGDAIMEIKNQDNSVEATVIAYQDIML